MALLLSGERRQQIRLAQSGLAILLMLPCVLIVNLMDAYGIADTRWVLPWTLCSIGGMAAIFVVIRSGRVRHWRDPSLTMLQMFYAITCAAAAYCITGTERALVIAILAVVLMFGMFGVTQRQVLIVGAYTMAAFGIAILYWIDLAETRAAASPELARFIMIVSVMCGVVVLTGRLNRMRERSRRQRAALSTAVERIRILATRDELTGCLNRRAMRECLRQERLRCARSGGSMCVAMLDLDHFKRINDAFGHASGDAVLRGFADIARRCLRDTDRLARWGGEEFVVLLGGTDALQAMLCMQRLLDAVALARFAGVDSETVVTCSAGIAECGSSESIEAALDRSDQALYRAKQSGRNRLVCL
jgi:diguanylate cyclase